MLTDLYIRHFAIIEQSHLELSTGMTALTGETGAGKSMLLDALGVVLGQRASSELVQQGRERAEITAVFGVDSEPGVQAWLSESELDAEGDCILRRTLTSGGKSKASINGTPVALAQLKELGQRLIAIHGQHAHQSLTRSTSQRQVLDRFAPNPLIAQVSVAHDAWLAAQRALNTLVDASEAHQQRLDLLSFQLQEFDDLDIGGIPISALEEEHRWRANAEELMSLCARTSEGLDTQVESGLVTVTRDLEAVVKLDESVREALDLVESAAIQCTEASSLISRRLSDLDHDDARLSWLDARLSRLHRLSRKHQCSTAELDVKEQALRDEFDALAHPEASLEELTGLRDARLAEYEALASRLTRHRRKHGKKLSAIITDAMQSLNMSGAAFAVEVTAERPNSANETVRPSAQGSDTVQFLVSTNPGSALAPLSRIASGGELSRISLCIQLATIESHSVPTLIFDEVDAGIGGAVAETVGKLLRQVGAHAQVLCVTHLPQVAAQAHHHLQVMKSSTKDQTRTDVKRLNNRETQEEIARMLGGARLTAKSRQHAREMLESVDEA